MVAARRHGAIAVGLLLPLVAISSSAGCARVRPVSAPTVVYIEGVTGGPGIAASGERSESGGSWRAKDEVEVEWHGSWWPAVVMEKRGNRWLVHYENYGTDWDEVVAADRIRERRAELEGEESEKEDDQPDP